MKSLKSILPFAMLTSILASGKASNNLTRHNVDMRPVKPVQPKGTQRFEFNHSSGKVFTTFAINNKNAKRKYEAWKQTNNL
jgi:hypothetical protein